MKAAQVTKYGEPEVLKTVNDAPKPAPVADQVLVEVYAASVNPFDYKVLSGAFQENIPLNFPATLGGDVAGVVAELGSEVSGFEIGQEVYGQANAISGQGSYAEFTPVKAESLTSKPKSLDFANAAALPLAGSSAYQAIVDTIHLASGQKILIHGGAGGIGSIAIQIAKHLGTYVATTATGEGIQFVRNLGADQIIDYQAQDFTTVIKDYDAVFDTVGGETYTKSYQVLKPGGILVSMVGQADEKLAEQYSVKAFLQSSKVTAERLNKLAELVDNGAIKVQVDKVFPIEEAGQALGYLKDQHPLGKVVIKVKPA